MNRKVARERLHIQHEIKPTACLGSRPHIVGANLINLLSALSSLMEKLFVKVLYLWFITAYKMQFGQKKYG